MTTESKPKSTTETHAWVRGLSGLWHAAPVLADGKPALVAHCGYQPLARGWRQVVAPRFFEDSSVCQSCRNGLAKRGLVTVEGVKPW